MPSPKVVDASNNQRWRLVRHPGRAFGSLKIPLLLLVPVGLIFFVACSGAAAFVTRSSDAAPDFELVLFSNENHEKGEVLRLSQLAGKPVVINFWFPSCPPCRLEMPDLEKTFREHEDDGVEFIGVQQLGLDSAEDGQEFIDEFGVTYAVGPDSDNSILINHQVTGFPTTVFLSKSHEVVRKWTGLLNAEKMEEFVQELLE